MFFWDSDFMYGSLGLGMDEDARVGKLAIQDDEVLSATE